MRALLLVLALLLVHSLVPRIPAIRSAATQEHVFLPIIVAPPASVKVVSIYISGTRNQGPTAQGELLNTTTAPVYDVQLELTAYNTENIAVYTTTRVSLLRAIHPGEISAFYIGLPYAVYGEVRVQVISWKTSILEQIVPLEVLQYDVELNTVGGMSLQVTIRNNSLFSVQHIVALAWSLPQGSILVPTTFQEALSPGEVITVTLYVYQSTSTSSIRIQTQGLIGS